MLWMSWLVVGLYDVRFVTDSIFGMFISPPQSLSPIYIVVPQLTHVERLIRAVHLGVFVGFAVVAPKFNPNDQDLTSMRSMCRFLPFSENASQVLTFLPDSHHFNGL